MKYSYLYCIITLSTLTACNFNKSQPDELVSLTDAVLKKNEGVIITVEPVKK